MLMRTTWLPGKMTGNWQRSFCKSEHCSWAIDCSFIWLDFKRLHALLCFAPLTRSYFGSMRCFLECIKALSTTSSPVQLRPLIQSSSFQGGRGEKKGVMCLVGQLPNLSQTQVFRRENKTKQEWVVLNGGAIIWHRACYIVCTKWRGNQGQTLKPDCLNLNPGSVPYQLHEHRKLLTLLMPQFSHLQHGGNISVSQGWSKESVTKYMHILVHIFSLQHMLN